MGTMYVIERADSNLFSICLDVDEAMTIEQAKANIVRLLDECIDTIMTGTNELVGVDEISRYRLFIAKEKLD